MFTSKLISPESTFQELTQLIHQNLFTYTYSNPAYIDEFPCPYIKITLSTQIFV